MFETAVSYGPPSHRVWTTFMGMTGQAILLACAIAIPLWFPAALPRMQAPVTWLTAPELPPAPAPPAAPVVRTAPPAASAAPPRVRIGGVVELEGVVGWTAAFAS